MLNFSEITLIGRLGKNPEVYTNKDGEDFVTLSLASNRKDEEPTWYQVIVNGEQAQYVWENYRVGDAIWVRGYFRVKKWQDQNGESRLTFRVKAGLTALLHKVAESSANEESASDTHHESYDEAPEAPSTPTPPKSTKKATFGKNHYCNRRAA